MVGGKMDCGRQCNFRDSGLDVKISPWHSFSGAILFTAVIVLAMSVMFSKKSGSNIKYCLSGALKIRGRGYRKPFRLPSAKRTRQ
jgi:hypothetical protein